MVSRSGHEQLRTEYVGALEAGGSKGFAKLIATRVAAWLRARRIPGSGEISFKSWLEYWDCPLDGAVALVMCCDSSGILEYLEGKGEGEWNDFMDSLDLYYGLHDYGIWLFNPKDVTVTAALEDVTDFEWAARLVAPDFAEIYSDAFTYFADRAHRLRELHWREFEEFLASVFTAKGYKTTLGKGTADGGVDLRLVENGVYGELVTLVQVKRYAANRAINLEKVAALSGVIYDQNADQAIFVTTSRFLKSAVKFADRQIRPIQLVTGSEVASWCEVISTQRSQSDWLRAAAGNYRLDPNKIIVATVGNGMTDHKFACIVAETSSAIRIAPLSEKRQSHDHWTRGWVEPDLSIPLDPEKATTTARLYTNRDEKFYELDKDRAFWGDDANLYTVWDHAPRWYDLSD